MLYMGKKGKEPRGALSLYLSPKATGAAAAPVQCQG